MSTSTSEVDSFTAADDLDGSALETPGLEARAEQIMAKRLDSTYRHTDRMFAYLMFFQWLVGICFAMCFSPRTWSGAVSSVSPHVWAAVLLGGAISLLAIFSAVTAPGKPSTRHIIAVCQMLYSALFIGLTNGRIETHFHVFGSLAFLAFYRDWRVLVTASVVVAIDHVLRGYFVPFSVYGIMSASPWRWVEHAAWVAFEDVFLLIGVARTIRELRETALQSALLMATDESLRASSAERERLLAEAIDSADKDALTGLPNHRSFRRIIEGLLNLNGKQGAEFSIVLLDLDNFKIFNEAYGQAAGDRVLCRFAEFLGDNIRTADMLVRFGNDEFAVVMPKTCAVAVRQILIDLNSKLEELVYRPDPQGSVIPISATVGYATYPDDGATRHALLEKLDERIRRAKLDDNIDSETEELRKSLLSTIDGFPMLDSLLTTVDNKDHYTRRHSEDVMTYSLAIAEQLGLSDEQREDIRVAALLHDIGKIGVPDLILRKPGKLTAEEYEVVKRHPVMGAIIVAAVPGLENTLAAVRHHHERWDGKGYPDGLAGMETPLAARLMAVADALSAMTTDRPYRKGMPREVALDILEKGAGTQWDPECVDAILNVYRSASGLRGPVERAA